ncbi:MULTISPECIES: TonB-dependent siderophore receptor [unclassified Tatumella]|uniref:TonB-dependent receptor n=1 Tax=unclassified Tatumella TaxID=2649542 RepID=UPI001BAF6EF7|nr:MULTISPECIES: TonB-dependent siderophore receptor [unclassified Tatumella]MBS0854562.1 TonB-dependent siderophore receptor [Tatumella sp. JGM16]MBS0911266.1 TonB-dependent siderophore receptor [Tatumella sp. JGM91]
MVQECKGRNSLLYLSLLASFSSVAVPVSPQTLVVQAKSANTDATQQQATLGNPGNTSIKYTPWSVQALSASMMNAQQLKSVSQLYRYMPSVQGEGARPQTRGMQGSVVQNSMIDGLNVVSTTDYSAEQFDHIEVLNGLAGSLYGPANPAGLFNFVSKRGTDTPYHSLTAGGGSGLTHKLAGDFSGPLGSSDRVRYRANLLDDEGNGYVKGSKIRRQLFSLALDANLTDHTLLESNFSDYHYYDKGLAGKFALTKGVSFPSPLNPRTAHLGQSYAGDNNHTLTAGMHLKHDFDGNWLGEIGVLRQIADRESTAVTNTLTDNAGHYTTTTSSNTASRFTINSYLANLSGEIDTGVLRHKVSAGIRGFSWKNYNPVNGSTQTLGSASLSDPQSFTEPDYPDFTKRYHSASTTQTALLLSDTLIFSPQWSTVLAGSESQLATSNYNKSGLRTSDSSDHGFSGSASVLYKPVDLLTLYLTYADSLQQGDTAPAGASNAGNILAPYRSKQAEAGSKLAVGRMLLTAAVFQIKRPFAYTNSSGVYALDGEQRNRGLELMATGDATDNLHIYGGMSWLDPRLRNTASTATDNKQVVGLSRYTASLFASYDLPALAGTEVHTGLRYMGRRSTDNTNATWTGSYTTADAGASWKTRLFAQSTTFRLDVTNLTNRHYWTNIVPGGLNGYTGVGYASAQPGEPRMAEVSMQVVF